MRKILVDPDPRLRKICAEVTNIDGKIIKLAAELLSIIRHMRDHPKKYEQHPFGLAACQVGELVQLFVIDTPAYSLTMINPTMTKISGSHKVVEGCLSLPGRMFLVDRPKVVKVRGLDLDGRERSVKFHDLMAQVLIHEVEHLNGIMVDNVTLGEIPKPDSHT